MGDKNRNIKFCSFLKKQFPKAKNILCIADGKGELSRKLANDDKNVFVIESKPRFQGHLHKNIIYKEGWFDREIQFDQIDLIVGMHPDEATSEIILWGEKNKVSWAVVPCCVKGKWEIIHGVDNYTQWLKKLKTLGPNCNEKRLPIQGKNIVMWKHY